MLTNPARRQAAHPSPIAHPHHTGRPSSADSPIRLLLVEDLDLFRTALASLLSDEPDIEVLAAVKDHQTASQVALRLRPDVIVLDVDSPRGAALSTIRDLRHRLPHTQIVALTTATPTDLVQRLLAADVLGAIDTNAPAEQLLNAIRGAATGTVVVDPGLAIAALAAAPNPLTPRERQSPPARRRGRGQPRHRHTTAPITRDGTQLPIQRRNQNRCTNPNRRRPHRA